MFLARIDVTLASYEMEGFEVSSKSLSVMPSWIDWWMVTAKVMANSSQQEDIAKVHHLFMAERKVIEHLSNFWSTLWANCIFERKNVALVEEQLCILIRAIPCSGPLQDLREDCF